jgi:hypothetical protein
VSNVASVPRRDAAGSRNRIGAADAPVRDLQTLSGVHGEVVAIQFLERDSVYPG